MSVGVADSNSHYKYERLLNMARRGPIPKADRDQFTFKLPKEHLKIYRAQAQEAGLPLGDYLAARLADDHGLDLPYVKRPDGNQLGFPGMDHRRTA